MSNSHKFYEKDFDGNWNVYCVASKGRFNTILWSQGKEKDQICPCCKGDVKE